MELRSLHDNEFVCLIEAILISQPNFHFALFSTKPSIMVIWRPDERLTPWDLKSDTKNV